MFTLLFVILMLMVIGEVIGLSVKLAWGVTKAIFTIAGAIIVGALLLSGGFAVVAIILLVLAGIGGLAAEALS